MKTMLTLALATFITVGVSAPKAQAAAVTSTVVGVVVAQYAGAAAGVAVSSLLYGTALVAGASKESVAKAVENDLQEYYLNGTLSVALEKSVNELMSMDAELSEADAVESIAASF